MTSSRGTPAEVNQDMILGEMRGQLREVVHSLNNFTQKFDALTREVVGLVILGNEVTSLNSNVATLKIAVAELQLERSHREGAVGVVETILKSPLLGWLVGLAITGIAILKGWVRVP